MKFRDAKNKCKSDGAYLAFPRSNAENTFIADFILSHDDELWIGVNDIDEEGRFFTVDGLEVSYTNWYGSQPNGDGDGVVIDYDGEWWDRGMSDEYGFVCMYQIDGEL